MKGPTDKNMVVVINEDWHHRLKVFAAEQSTSISGLVRGALEKTGYSLDNDEWKPLIKKEK